MKLNLDPYQNEANWLNKQEVVDTKEQIQITDVQMIRDFDVSKTQYHKLMNGKIDKIKVGKKSPHFDYEIIVPANPKNPDSRAGWLDTRDKDKIKEIQMELLNV